MSLKIYFKALTKVSNDLFSFTFSCWLENAHISDLPCSHTGAGITGSWKFPRSPTASVAVTMTAQLFTPERCVCYACTVKARALPTRAEQSRRHSFISALHLDETPSCPAPAFVYSVGSWVGSLGFKNWKPSFFALREMWTWFLIDIQYARLPWLGKLNVNGAPSV